jgi:hypothetical protein
LNLFAEIYGQTAGDWALAAQARGGIFLAGGIAPKLLPALQNGGISWPVHAKGRYRAWMRACPGRSSSIRISASRARPTRQLNLDRAAVRRSAPRSCPPSLVSRLADAAEATLKFSLLMNSGKSRTREKTPASRVPANAAACAAPPRVNRVLTSPKREPARSAARSLNEKPLPPWASFNSLYKPAMFDKVSPPVAARKADNAKCCEKSLRPGQFDRCAFFVLAMPWRDSKRLPKAFRPDWSTPRDFRHRIMRISNVAAPARMHRAQQDRKIPAVEPAARRAITFNIASSTPCATPPASIFAPPRRAR